MMDKYIILYKGDDSDFTGNQTIEITLDTTLSLTGFKATFKFLDYEQTFDTIPDTKILTLTFPAAQTKLWAMGSYDGEIWLTDTNGKRRTVANRIHVVVTKSIKDAYDNDDTQAITVNFSGGGCTWDKVGKPLTTSNVFDMECSDWEFRKVCATLWNLLGGKVENNDD